MREPTLEDVSRAEVSTDGKIRDFLAMYGSLECVVTRTGAVFLVEDKNTPRRVVKALLELVGQVHRAKRLVMVTPLDYQKWNGEHKPQSGRAVASERREANKTVQYVFERAIDARASDVYLDIYREHSSLAFRTYGFKRDVQEFGREDGKALARSMWSMGQSTQYDESGTCDTTFEVEHGGKMYRVRGNSMKDVRGNSVVCRVRDPSFVLSLEDSGYSDDQVEDIRRMCAAPGGLILITGETNSGKSTTLASLMASLPASQKVIEVADPVEVEMAHVTHVEINHYHEDAEEQFQGVLAALVRQNPDTLVLGEIRDGQTAAAAETMAIQGKRVFSTLHTQTCASAIPRLANLGVSESLLGTRSFLAGIVNQNLVPVVCPSCGLAGHPEPDAERRYRVLFGEGAPLRYINEKGCDECRGGVSGQTLVAEVYPLCVEREGRAHAFIADGKLAQLEAYMRKGAVGGRGCETKHQHAASKIAAGLVDPVETERIIGELHPTDVAEVANVVALPNRGRERAER